MSLNTEENRILLIDAFPKLQDDPFFVITSPIDPVYNCIAWANKETKKWWWPVELQLEAVFWPIENKDSHFQTLIELFSARGFQLCDAPDLEANKIKIAIYITPDEKFTHAARQTPQGIWQSKIGNSFDIIHGTPFDIENDIYGEAKIFMSTAFYTNTPSGTKKQKKGDRRKTR